MRANFTFLVKNSLCSILHHSHFFVPFNCTPFRMYIVHIQTYTCILDTYLTEFNYSPFPNHQTSMLFDLFRSRNTRQKYDVHDAKFEYLISQFSLLRKFCIVSCSNKSKTDMGHPLNILYNQIAQQLQITCLWFVHFQ